MKKNVTIGLVVSLLSLNFCVTAQEPTQISPIYGTPDKFQRYFVFDNISYPEVQKWVLNISHEFFKPGDSTIERRLFETVSVGDKNFFKLEDNHYGQDFGTHVEVIGFDGVGNVVIEDEWVRPVPVGGTSYTDEVCKGICNGSTYSYGVKILKEVDTQTGIPTGAANHKVSFTDPEFLYEPNAGLYVPLYRYMTTTEFENMQLNSSGPSEWMFNNRFAHYDVPFNTTTYDGIKVVYHPNAATGEFRNSSNIKINAGEVWGVQKFFGVYRNDRPQESVTLAQDPGGICGILMSNTGSSAQNQINEAINYTNYANSHLVFTNSTQELVCSNPWPVPGTTISGPKPPLPNVDEYVFVHDAWIDWINDDITNPSTGGGLFDLMEATFQGVRSEEIYTNTTGVPWWPGDVFDYIQLYRVDKTTSQEFALPYTIYRDSLFNENGSLKSFEINTPAGLYNLSLTISESSFNMPLLVDFPSDMVHQSTESLCDRLVVSIFPVPIVDKKFTTQVRLDEKAKFRYSVMDELGSTHFQRTVNVRENQVHKIPVTTPHLPNGLIFHTFEIEGECVRTITTIKNE